MTALFDVVLAKPEFECGETLVGVVRFLEPGHETLAKATAVRLRVRAQVHGSGGSESHGPELVTLHQGPVTMPELAFSVPLPANGPISWQGRHVKIDWGVLVELDVPWAVDPSKLVPFKLTARRAK